MRAFACQNCGQLVFFENDACLNCGAALGFDWPTRELLTLFESRPRCANAELAGCNWLVSEPGELCFSCALTRIRPADGDELGLSELRVAEAAKRRLLFELGELGLPIEPRDGGDSGLGFDLLSSAWQPVTTGHADGVITLDLAESDDAHRAAMREQMGEPYRTVLGHLRHEIGHYYFPILVGPELERARGLFGDERADYSAALERHYAEGPPPGWFESFVSAYATVHPAEDWAETFAHYLHIRDALQTAAAYGVRVDGPRAPARGELESNPDGEPEWDFEAAFAEWLPLTYALNAINRSMGRSDLYPFVISEPVRRKLTFVDERVRARRG
jgi:hypothetical protein